MGKKEEDVKSDSSTDLPDQDDQGDDRSPEDDNDKDKNFANLRKSRDDAIARAEAAEAENARLKGEDGGNRDLGDDEEDEEEEEEQKDDKKSKKTDKKDTSTQPSAVFIRDRKEAALKWNQKNKVSADIWKKIQGAVTLTGNETETEIYNKIENAYLNIPEVRQQRDKKLIEKGRALERGEISDDDMDIGGGLGGDIDGGGNDRGGKPRHNAKTKKWAKGLGLKDKELGEIDPDEDTSDYRILDPKYQDRDADDED